MSLSRFKVAARDDLSLVLIRQKARWRKSMAGQSSRQRRRFARDKARKLSERLVRLGVSKDVATASVELESMGWVRPQADQINIVIVPGSDVGAAEVDERPIAEKQRQIAHFKRKTLRRLLHDLPDARVELISSRHKDGPAIGLTGLSSEKMSPKKSIRAVHLEAIGAAICPELSKSEVEQLKNSGAVILQNQPIELVDTMSFEEVSSTDGSIQGTCWHLGHIGIDVARKKGLTGKGIVIGILDTGIDASHREFAQKQIAFQEFDGTGQRVARSSPRDCDRHGTHVSALCAGSGVGVAPAAQLAVAAVLTEKSTSGMCGRPAQILAGLNWLIRGDGNLPRPADVINASLSKRGMDPYWYERIQGARNVDGVLMIAAIGNNGGSRIGNHGSPGNYDLVLGIGAVDANDAVAPFSDWGPANHPQGLGAGVSKPDILAPGVNILSAIPRARYGRLSGTSMASPIVTGAAALLLEDDPKLKQDPVGLVQRLCALVKPNSGPTHPHAARRGHGSLDLSLL